MAYQKIKPKPIFQQIIEQIRAQIVEGTLKPGDILPPERQISELMGVNRHTVREALKVLEYVGVLESKTGVGTIIKNVGPEALVEGLSAAARFSPRHFLCELMELRLALEPRIAALAAERATPEDLALMDRAMADLSAEVESGVLGTDADERLHLALAKATHNETFVRLTEPIMAFLAQYRERSLLVPGRRAKTHEEHRRIYWAVRQGRTEEAAAAMIDHLKQVEAMIQKMEDDRTD